jgi:transposase
MKSIKEPAAVQAKKTRRKYDPNFKKEAVSLWLSSGKTAAVIGQELGIPPEQLYTWKSLLQPRSVQGSSTQDLEAEVALLRRENEHLRQQRDILKKTLSIVTEPQPSAINSSKP